MKYQQGKWLLFIVKNSPKVLHTHKFQNKKTLTCSTLYLLRYDKALFLHYLPSIVYNYILTRQALLHFLDIAAIFCLTTLLFYQRPAYVPLFVSFLSYYIYLLSTAGNINITHTNSLIIITATAAAANFNLQSLTYCYHIWQTVLVKLQILIPWKLCFFCKAPVPIITTIYIPSHQRCMLLYLGDDLIHDIIIVERDIIHRRF